MWGEEDSAAACLIDRKIEVYQYRNLWYATVDLKVSERTEDAMDIRIKKLEFKGIKVKGMKVKISERFIIIIGGAILVYFGSAFGCETSGMQLYSSILSGILGGG